MKVFTCTNFEGFYPVGTSAIIVAVDKKQAREFLLKALPKDLRGKNSSKELVFNEVDLVTTNCVILQDGNY